jgi:hypothetical protein
MLLSTPNDDLVELDDLIEALVRVTVHMKFQRVPACRQHKLEPNCEYLWHSDVCVCEPTPSRMDTDPPLHRALPWIMVPNLYLAPFRTRHRLVKSDLEDDLLASPRLIPLQELSGDGECRVRAQEGFDIPSAT